MNRTDARTSEPAVLLVEDDPDIRDILTLILKEEGYLVVEAANGAEALRRLQRGPAVGLIVLDLIMPVMNGWEFRAQQKKDPRLADIPVIAMSASGSAPERGGELDAAVYLAKPVPMEQIVSAVKRHYRAPAP